MLINKLQRYKNAYIKVFEKLSSVLREVQLS